MGFGVAPNARIYEHLAEGYALHAQPRAALAVLQRMAAAGLVAEGRTYKRLAHALGATGALSEARQLYTAMCAQVSQVRWQLGVW
jgi:hypothetical protein